MILGGDAVWDVIGSDVDASPSIDGVTFQVMVIVPAKAGSSETKSTACTTLTSGTMSTYRASTMSESAVAFPAAREASE